MNWQDIVDWSNAHNGMIALVALVVAFIALFPSRTETRVAAYKAQIANPPSWPGLIGELRQGSSEAYFRGIGRVLGFADRIWGPSLSWRAFDRCLILAFLYPLLAVLLGWVAVNLHSPGGYTLFRDEPSLAVRLGRAALALVGWAVALWIARNAERFSTFVVDRVAGPLDTDTARAGFLAKAARAVVEFLAVAVAGAVAFAVAGAVAGAVAFAFAFAVAFAFAFAVAVAGAFAVAFAFAVALTAGDIEPLVVIALFFFLLPFLNAGADFASLAVTRRFLSNLDRRERRPGLAIILGKLTLDLIWAVVCLAVLLASLVLALDIWAWLFPDTLPFEWRAYWRGVQVDWTTGTALYLMVFTTLLPTLVHVAAGLGAVLTHRSRLTGRVARRLETAIAAGEDLNVRDQETLSDDLRRAILHGRRLGWAIALAGFGLVGWGIIWVLFVLEGPVAVAG